MAKRSGLGGLYFLHGFNLSGDIGSLNRVHAGRRFLDNQQGLDLLGVERIGALADGLIDFNTFFNKAAGASHLALKLPPTTDIIGCYVVGTAVGDPVACLVGKQENYDHTRGADMKVPRVFYYILKYVTPAFLIGLLGVWLYQGGLDTILFKNVTPEDLPYVIGVRGLLLCMLLGLIDYAIGTLEAAIWVKDLPVGALPIQAAPKPQTQAQKLALAEGRKYRHRPYPS